MERQIKEYRIPLFYLVTSLYWFSLYTYVPNLSIYAETLGVPHRMIGLIISSYGFTQMILRIPLGIYSDTINRRKVFILLGSVASIISAVGMGLFKDPWALLFFRGLSGVSASAWVPFTVLFSSYFASQDSPRAMGYINSFSALGQMLALLLGGIIANSLSSLRAPFFLAMGMGILTLILSIGIVEKREMKEPLKVTQLLTVAKERQLLIPSGLAILVQLLTFATVYGFTPIAAREMGANQAQTGILTTLSTLPGIFASAMSGSIFAKKFGERKSLSIGFLVMAFSALLIPIINNLNLLYLSQMAGGFARGFTISLLMSLSIQSVEHDKRATAMGFFQAIYSLGMFIGPIIVGIISDLLGLSWGFWITGCIGIVGSLLSFILINNTGAETS